MTCAICGAPSIAKETLDFPPAKRLCPDHFERCGRPELPMSDEVLRVLRADCARVKELRSVRALSERRTG